MKKKESCISSEIIYEKENNGCEYRYLLKRTWGNYENRKIAAVIMFNPSYADELKYDRSSMNVINYLIDTNKYNGVNILNLYPIKYTNSQDIVNEKKTANQDKNCSVIECAFNESGDIYVAWGSDRNNKKMIKKIKELMIRCNHNCYYQLINSNNKPIHPSRCAIASAVKIKL